MAADPQRPLFHPVAPPRREDHRLVTGAGRFVADLAPPGTLQLAFARSSEAHALILGIDTTEAARAEGVAMVATAADLDLPDIPGRSVAVDAAGFSRPHLAGERVRYVGEPIAVVAAEGAARAIDAAELIWVEYDPLQVVADATAAVNDQTILHPAAGSNVVERWELGSPDGADQGEIAVELTVHNQRLAPVAVEPLAILVEPGSDRTLTVWCGHQRPHELRTRLARLLGIEPAAIRVIVPDVGGAFGMKGMMFPEYTVAAAMAIRLQRPVIWAERRREHFSGGTHGRGSTHTVRLCGGRDGRVLRADLAELADVGAYPHSGSSIPAFSRYVATGLYDFPEVHISTTTVVTNRAPTGSYRGAGRPEAAYAIERAIDAYARAAGIDPVEVRLVNFIRDLPFTTSTGAIYDSGDYAAALRKAVEVVGLEEVRQQQEERRTRGGRPIGVGIGAFVERAGGAVDTGEYGRVEVDPTGKVTVRTGSTSSGQGHETVWPEVVAAALGIPADRVSLVAGDTGQVAKGTGTAASRSAQIGASAAWRTALVVRQQAVDLAADLLEAAPVDIEISGGRFSIAGVPGAGLTWDEVAAQAKEHGVELAAEEWYVPGAQTFPYGVHVAVVEVDVETGEVTLSKMVTVDDCGNVLNPMVVQGQIEGSLLQGIGQALYEGVVYDSEGQLLTSTLVDYQVPRATDAPPLTHARLVHPAPSNPLGVKGAGESGCIGAPPAIVNAVLDALAPYGVTHLDMPLHPATVWRAVQAARDDR
ncbi:MAG TPA: xanthine dehydrogenase family protein molybdopterin-binding subunit [Acidimicrobiia bacterium]|jgi:carbon-monoxide dehydrogenase large subunit|nr:xanthine dehydrogenase family protein molybdopterin-binding subunit [Acidimicrobiia bacterium]